MGWEFLSAKIENFAEKMMILFFSLVMDSAVTIPANGSSLL
jgi:hypothetical protein